MVLPLPVFSFSPFPLSLLTPSPSSPPPSPSTHCPGCAGFVSHGLSASRPRGWLAWGPREVLAPFSKVHLLSSSLSPGANLRPPSFSRERPASRRKAQTPGVAFHGSYGPTCNTQWALLDGGPHGQRRLPQRGASPGLSASSIPGPRVLGVAVCPSTLVWDRKQGLPDQLAIRRLFP